MASDSSSRGPASALGTRVSHLRRSESWPDLCDLRAAKEAEATRREETLATRWSVLGTQAQAG